VTNQKDFFFVISTHLNFPVVGYSIKNQLPSFLWGFLQSKPRVTYLAVSQAFSGNFVGGISGLKRMWQPRLVSNFYFVFVTKSLWFELIVLWMLHVQPDNGNTGMPSEKCGGVDGTLLVSLTLSPCKPGILFYFTDHCLCCKAGGGWQFGWP